MSSDSVNITQLLGSWQDGDEGAGEALMAAVYGQLRSIADHHLRSERPDHTLQATELVHEAYLRLVDSGAPWQNRAHFFAVAARAMRRILVDHARSHHRLKRGAGAARVTFEGIDEAAAFAADGTPLILALDSALDRLATHDSRKSQLVELLFFGGASREDAAAATGISLATLHREVKLARAWLVKDINERPLK